MLDRILSILQQNQILELRNRIVIGVSGGPDSLCLLDNMVQLGLPLVVAHMNHSLRPEAGEEARRVAQLAAHLGLQYVETQVDVRGYAEAHSLSVEEAARTLRYRFLFDQAAATGAQSVMVAHTADDQVETVLMHLLRGAGLAGLRGMEEFSLPNPWSQTIPLVRPLLAVWREEVLDYCQKRGLEPVYDPTNLDTTYFRNRLRHELIPVLESYNPGVRQLLWRTANILSEDYKVIERLAAKAWDQCVLDNSPQKGYLLMARTCLLEEMLSVQRFVMRKAITELRPGLRDLDFAVIDQALRFFANPTQTRRKDLIAGLQLFAEGDHVWLAAWEADLPALEWPQMSVDCPEVELDVSGQVALPGGWILSAELAAGEEVYRRALENKDPFQAWLEPDQISHGLRVRCRLRGDRFQPLGLENGSMKLSDFMINRKLPWRLRRGWPVVVDGDRLVWIPGFSLNHLYRLRPDANQVLHLKLERNSNE